MRKLFAGMLIVAGFAAGTGRVQAWQGNHYGPWAQTAAFPNANPPGWYTNTYSFAWQYPWFAYYNYSHGPYANWMAGGGRATYSTFAGARFDPNGWGGAGVVMAQGGHAVPGGVTVNLPTDAKLLFNGTAATGTGAVRAFTTPPLQPGMEYAYDLTAEVVRDGKPQTVTERVVVRAGETASVTLAIGGK